GWSFRRRRIDHCDLGLDCGFAGPSALGCLGLDGNGLRLFGRPGLGDRRLFVDRPLDHGRAIGVDLDLDLGGGSATAATAPAAFAHFARLLRYGLNGDSLGLDRLVSGLEGDYLAGFHGLTALTPAASPPAAPAPTPATSLPLAFGFAFTSARVTRLALFFLVLVLGFDRLVLELFLFVQDRSFCTRLGNGPWAGAVDAHSGAFEALVDQNVDHDAVAL